MIKPLRPDVSLVSGVEDIRTLSYEIKDDVYDLTRFEGRLVSTRDRSSFVSGLHVGKTFIL